jgi:hypothetical protein
MFSGARELMVKWFQQDLNEDQLADMKDWQATGGHPMIQHVKPLPRSNSNGAKTMRIAACLSMLGRASAKHIMRPTYLVQDDGIDYALAEMARQNAEQNTYVRATLLKALPEEQEKGRRRGIQMVVKEVMEAMKGWISEGDRPVFSSELEGTTARISEAWVQMQMLEETVAPQFEAVYDGEWKPLPALPAVRLEDGMGAQNRESGKVDKKGRAAEELVVIPIWPSFTSLGWDGEKPLFPGFGLTGGQVAAVEQG